MYVGEYEKQIGGGLGLIYTDFSHARAVCGYYMLRCV